LRTKPSTHCTFQRRASITLRRGGPKDRSCRPGGGAQCGNAPARTSGDQIGTTGRSNPELQLKRAESCLKMRKSQEISVRLSVCHANAAIKSKYIPNRTTRRRFLV